jgi:transcriptional regulator with XRE-family HTH domain
MDDMGSFTAEDIKNGRERLRMTQQQLADELGVSLRTVGAWERGESIPRNRMAAIAEVLGGEGVSEFGAKALLRRLGQLAKQRREEIGIGRQQMAREAGLGSDRTIVEFEFGRTLPSGTSQRKIEKALDWRSGVIDDTMRMVNRKASDITMESLDAEDSLYLESQGVKSIELFSDDELLAEVHRRMSASSRHLSEAAQNMYGLAASTNVEHLEGEDEDEDKD